MKLSEMELKTLIRGGETNTVELKVAAPRAMEMAERYCGMANAQGGVVIIGVKDSLHEIVGVPDHRIGETLDVILRAVRQNVRLALVLDPPKPELYELGGKRLVVAAVPLSRGPEYQSGGVFWVRRVTHMVPLDASELLEVMGSKGLVDWEDQPVRGSTMEDIDIDMGKVETYLKQRSTRERQPDRFEHVEQIFSRISIATNGPADSIFSVCLDGKTDK